MVYLISDDKYFFCRESTDLLVTDPSLVKVGEMVNISFGSKSFAGEVLDISGCEDDILTEISRRSKEKVQIIKEGSFPPGKKGRKSAKAQMDKMKEVFSKGKPEKIPRKRKENALYEAAKETAEIAMELALISGESEQDSPAVSSSESSSDSASASAQSDLRNN